MDFVHDQKIELARGAPVVDAREHLVEQRPSTTILQPVDRHDQARERRKDIRPDAAITAEPN